MSDSSLFRAQLFVIGLLAGFSSFITFDYLPDTLVNKRVVLFVGALLMSGFFSLLLLAGTLTWRKAVRYGVPIALVASALLVWSSFRFDMSSFKYLSPIAVSAFIKGVAICLPFVVAIETADAGWRDYSVLFKTAWAMVVKIIVAALFCGLMWGVIWTSIFLLSLVGITFLEDIFEEEIVLLTLSGGIVGLALAVMYELKGVVETLRNVVVTLLRLLLPVVTAVIAVFLILVPFQGLENVFSRLSAAGTVMAMCTAGIALITATLDADNKTGTQHAFMQWCARILAAILPFMAAIAIYALTVRVTQYGWTPERLAGFVIALVIGVYALTYGLSAVFGRANWQGAIRRANLYLALGMVAVAALWLSPALNAERIATQSQLARFDAGKVTPPELALWEMKHKWGVAGTRGIEALKARDDDALKAQLVVLEAAKHKWGYSRNKDAADEISIVELIDLIKLYGGSKAQATRLIQSMRPYVRKEYLAHCESGKNCYLVFADFMPEQGGDEALLITKKTDGHNIKIGFFKPSPFDEKDEPVEFYPVYKGVYKAEVEAIFLALEAGDFNLEPVPMKQLRIGSSVFAPFRR